MVKLVLKVVLGLFLAFVLVSAGGIGYLLLGQSTGKNQVVNSVDFTKSKDGTYTGQFKNGRWTNQVQVTVVSGKVTHIDVVKDVKFPKPEWTDQLVKSVLQAQSLNVDAISGATITSKAYLKSMENALAQAR